VAKTDNLENSIWYEAVPSDQPLSQGQLLFALTVQVPKYVKPENENLRNQEFIVCTQSCDIDGIIEFDFQILLARIKYIEPGSIAKHRIKQIAKLTEPTSFLLPPSPLQGVEKYLICNFADLYTIRSTILVEHVRKQKPNVRLTPPFRDLFSHALGNVFSRVALEQNAWNRTDFIGDQKPVERQPLGQPSPNRID
jgi:hypothetical protein